MNANELADDLDKSREDSYTSEHLVGKAATMLRQQQAEIEALKKEAALQRLSDFTQEAESFDRTASHMAGEYVSYNEPVAWISVLAIDHIGKKFTDVRISLTKTDVADIPLYTHPAKTLTDDEIAKLADDILGYQIYGYKESGVYEFARAILRKAQEK